MTRITNDVETLNELFSSGVVTVFGDLFTLLFILEKVWVGEPPATSFMYRDQAVEAE